MIVGTIWEQLADTLENNATISTYIKNVFKGRRYNIEPDSLPCIMLEPSENNELEKDMNQIKDIFFNVDIYAFSSNCVNDPTKMFVGDANYKGIFELENDIRACLQSSYDLGGNVLDIRFDTTIFGENEKYLTVRGCVIPIRILYRQNNNA